MITFPEPVSLHSLLVGVVDNLRADHRRDRVGPGLVESPRPAVDLADYIREVDHYIAEMAGLACHTAEMVDHIAGVVGHTAGVAGHTAGVAGHTAGVAGHIAEMVGCTAEAEEASLEVGNRSPVAKGIASEADRYIRRGHSKEQALHTSPHGHHCLAHPSHRMKSRWHRGGVCKST